MINRRSLVTLSIATLMALAGTPPRAVFAEELVFHYENPFLLGVAGNTAVDQHDGGTGIPNRTVCFAYGLGSDALSTPLTWRVSDFTGLPLPGDQPLPVFQAGVNNAWYGSNACQIYQ